jgi:16S rRNA (uracil1498-N3)-methyltransferase
VRAVWLPIILNEHLHRVTGEAHHHLAHVLRIEVGDELLLLDGKGLCVKARTSLVSKKEIQLEEINREVRDRAFHLDLVLGIPKKEALELCLKQATELGFRTIFLVRAAYSQTKVPEIDRLVKLLSSALEQSNSAFLPEIVETSWSDIPWNEYDHKILLDSQTKESTQTLLSEVTSQSSHLLIVGPEGGFDSQELAELHAKAGMEILCLPTPILRTPTALAVGAGCVLQRLIVCK